MFQLAERDIIVPTLKLAIRRPTQRFVILPPNAQFSDYWASTAKMRLKTLHILELKVFTNQVWGNKLYQSCYRAIINSVRSCMSSWLLLPDSSKHIPVSKGIFLSYRDVRASSVWYVVLLSHRVYISNFIHRNRVFPYNRHISGNYLLFKASFAP